MSLVDPEIYGPARTPSPFDRTSFEQEFETLKRKAEKLTQALRFNEGKPKLSYFRRSFFRAVEAIARIKEFGANKYDDGNWRKGGKPDTEYLDSMDRHLDLWLKGEVYDSDSGCHHLGHAIWNLCALLELNTDEPVIDQELFAERMEYWRKKREERNGQESD